MTPFPTAHGSYEDTWTMFATPAHAGIARLRSAWRSATASAPRPASANVAGSGVVGPGPPPGGSGLSPPEPDVSWIEIVASMSVTFGSGGSIETPPLKVIAGV